MLVNGKHYRTVWIEGKVVKAINQLLLPHYFSVVSIKTSKDTARAIKDMIVRGAGAIGAAAAYGVAQAVLEAKSFDHVKNAVQTLQSTRPTAQNLFAGIDYVLKAIKGLSLNEAKKIAVIKANEFADYDANSCKAIGEHGKKLIKNNSKILTHCNAGWLAFVDWGTALSPIYAAKRSGKKVFVYVDETRPACQGSRLTAWELYHEKIPHAIIADNAAAFYGKNIDMVIVGSDRIASNGDIANKIGTYEKAIIAKELGIPFYVAAPTTSIDLNCASGDKIPIEERSEDEVKCMFGMFRGKLTRIKIASPKSHALNPVFDVTPARYIKGIITEKGIIKASRGEIKKLLK